MLVLIRLPASPNLKILMSNSEGAIIALQGVDDAASLLNLKAVLMVTFCLIVLSPDSYCTKHRSRNQSSFALKKFPTKIWLLTATICKDGHELHVLSQALYLGLMLLTLIYKGSTRRCGPLNRHNAMQLTLGEFEYLGRCMEGFLFGTLSVLQIPRPLTKSH
jgi:hypothetical protein